MAIKIFETKTKTLNLLLKGGRALQFRNHQLDVAFAAKQTGRSEEEIIQVIISKPGYSETAAPGALFWPKDARLSAEGISNIEEQLAANKINDASLRKKLAKFGIKVAVNATHAELVQAWGDLLTKDEPETAKG